VRAPAFGKRLTAVIAIDGVYDAGRHLGHEQPRLLPLDPLTSKRFSRNLIYLPQRDGGLSKDYGASV